MIYLIFYIMNKFKQIHTRPSNFSGSHSLIECRSNVNGHDYVSSFNLAIDQFFSEKHRLKNGFIDSSPASLDDSQAAAHLNPLTPETPLSAELSDSDIHDMILPKHCQSSADLAKVKSLRPNEADYQDDDKPIEENTVEPVISE